MRLRDASAVSKQSQHDTSDWNFEETETKWKVHWSMSRVWTDPDRMLVAFMSREVKEFLVKYNLDDNESQRDFRMFSTIGLGIYVFACNIELSTRSAHP